jgi:hypothetical protein
MTDSLASGSYALHGLQIEVVTDHKAIWAAVHARLRQFQAVRQSLNDLRFEFRCVTRRHDHVFDAPPPDARPVYDPPIGQVVFSDAEDRLYIVYGDEVRVCCNPSRGHTEVSITASALKQLWLVSHPLFTLPFLELMKRRGRYSIHAAGLAIDGQGLLLPAGSGSGKSTLALALLRAGFGFLGDDTLFLADDDGRLRVCAFPDEIDATETTLALFSELHPLLDQPKAPGAPKRQIWAEAVYGIDFVRACRPSVLVFPKITATTKSVVEPMNKDEALLELASNVLLTDARSSQAHLDALAALVKQSRCYRLATGRDFDDLPHLLARLLE